MPREMEIRVLMLAVDEASRPTSKPRLQPTQIPFGKRHKKGGELPPFMRPVLQQFIDGAWRDASVVDSRSENIDAAPNRDS